MVGWPGKLFIRKSNISNPRQRVFAFRDQYLNAFNRFMDVFDADGETDDSSTAEQKQVIDERALAVTQLYDDLCAAIRKELRARSLVRRP
jgi:hypothetical protein